GVDTSLGRRSGHETYCYCAVTSAWYHVDSATARQAASSAAAWASFASTRVAELIRDSSIPLSRGLNSSFGNSRNPSFLHARPPSVPRKCCKTGIAGGAAKRKVSCSPTVPGEGSREAVWRQPAKVLAAKGNCAGRREE